MEPDIAAKQQFLRTHVAADKQQDFCEYCENVVKDIDIGSWSMSQLERIVRSFNNKIQEQVLANQSANNKPTYYQYQSGQYANEQRSQVLTDQEPSEISECASSRVVKTPAIDLLDSALNQSYSVGTPQSRPSPPSSKGTTPQQYATNGSNFNTGTRSVNFDEFDFWTSTVGAGKNQDEIRPKSNSQLIKSTADSNYPRGSLAGSPTPKNSHYAPTSTFNNEQHNRPRHSTNLPASDPLNFDIFVGSTQPGDKKGSPYLKKQAMEPYQGQVSSIKLKEVREYHEQKPQPKDPVRSMPDAQGQIFEEAIECFKSTFREQLADPSLNVFIDKHQIIERKFFASDYAMYNVKVTPINRQLKRNYEDFAKLKVSLGKIFPGLCLPFLEEPGWFSGTNIEFVSNQKKMLEFFARDLIRNKQIRNSRVMQDFLTLKDHKAMKRKFEDYEKMGELKGLQQMCFLEGKVRCTLGSEQRAYIETFEKFLQKMDALYERQLDITETLKNQYYQMMNTLKSLVNLMEEMQKQIKEFNTKVTTNTIKYLGQAVRLVRQTYKQELSNMKFQHEINSQKVLPFLKYERRNFMELKQLLEMEAKMRRAFEKRSLTEKIGVGETYKSESAKADKRGIGEESSSLIVLKYQAGYFGHQCRHEAQRVFDELALKTVMKWQSLGESYADKLTTSIDYWRSVKKIDRANFRTELTAY